jgi:LacI family transcriptional regulator
MATLKEVAKRARVSIGTVSNVITGSVPVSPVRRARILEAIRRLGYHPDHVARSLRMRRTRMLGMVITDITNPFFSQMVRGAEDAALKHNYLLLIFNTDDHVDRERQGLAVLQGRRVDGVLLVVAPARETASHIAETLAAGTPVVCLDRIPRGARVHSVTVDNVRGARECVHHLLERGHRRVAILTGSLWLQTARERLRGYKEALKQAGVPVDPALIQEGDFRVESGYALARELLSRPRPPSALFTSNGLMAIGVLKAAAELRLRCPQDVAIATFDDLPVAEILRPTLTSVAQPAYLIGYKGAELLIQMIESKKKPKAPVRIKLPTELRIRESTGGARR